MPIQINMYEAKTKLSQLAEQALAGEEVIIAKNGKPYMELRPYAMPRRQRTPGRLAGEIHMAADFDDTPDEIIEAFEDRS
ncbi:type II toxin-antitoxin system Phd/YefM family antitoxin [Aquisalimonas lutea]|uniref:type II toxin-antitoxin system Phd/YefM family antitoxin n=1 Tax=Aquisalimonas lutea TaxID=1327750 RepID=UPI0025B5BDC9|nr:type II toxin-antitoxin system Phd/YefM family antitoxin [Aquisalimonas lutea]MDN3517134.1 type II toxin-antitoxin system Phd/YefM family antitoxin [Aquisalimonas lutea]